MGLARALRSAGHESVVLAPSDGPVEVPGLGEGSVVTLGRSVPVPANGSVAPVSLSPLSALRAVRTVKAGGFDVLNIHEPLAPSAGYGCLFACAQPKVGTFHRADAGLVYRIFGMAARGLTARLDVRCAVSPEAASTASKVLGGSYEVVGNGVEIERFARAEPWVTEGPTAVFVGRHERRKGLGVLLGAWDRTIREHSTKAAGVLWVAGEGPDTEDLRRRHPESRTLKWLGRIDDDELASRLAGADLLCAPSLGGESFGVVLLEAMAARTGVVASDLPGYAFASSGHALLVPPGDVPALCRALRQGLSDAASGTGLCASEALDAAQSHARSWSMEALASRYVGIFEALVH
jgi:phosphatidylinositol alpha-mannosyltransferase